MSTAQVFAAIVCTELALLLEFVAIATPNFTMCDVMGSDMDRYGLLYVRPFGGFCNSYISIASECHLTLLGVSGRLFTRLKAQ